MEIYFRKIKESFKNKIYTSFVVTKEKDKRTEIKKSTTF